MIDFPWAPWQWRGLLGFPGKGCWREAAAGVRRDNAETLLTLTQALRALEHRSFTLIYKQQLAFRLPHSLFARKYVFYCWLFFSSSIFLNGSMRVFTRVVLCIGGGACARVYDACGGPRLVLEILRRSFLPFLVKHGLSMKLKEHTSDWSFHPGDPLSLPS